MGAGNVVPFAVCRDYVHCTLTIFSDFQDKIMDEPYDGKFFSPTSQERETK